MEKSAGKKGKEPLVHKGTLRFYGEHTFEGRVSSDVRVQVPSSTPDENLQMISMSYESI